jgi:hypothetical protein
VKLEVEEDLASGSDKVADDLGAFGGEELLADLVDGGGVAHGLDDALGFGCIGDV